jgi:hypothetical protein
LVASNTHFLNKKAIFIANRKRLLLTSISQRESGLVNAERHEVFTVMKVYVVVFWVVTPYRDVEGCNGPSRHRYPTTSLHGVTSRKT